MLKGIKHYSFFGIPVDVQKVLQAFYDLDRQDSFDSDSRDIFQRNLNELLERKFVLVSTTQFHFLQAQTMSQPYLLSQQNKAFYVKV